MRVRFGHHGRSRLRGDGVSFVRRVAAIDCGTNSLRLLVADVDADSGRLHDVERRMEIVRLGQGVDRTGSLGEEALRRTFGVLRQYADSVRRHGAETVRFAATSATRDADNRAEFVDGVRELLGVTPEVLTGDQEAALSFVGATGELAGLPGPYLVVDIGGGSTEYVFGHEEAGPAVSVDIGSVRLTERYFHDDPPVPEQVEGAVADVDAALDRVERSVPITEAETLVGVAGTVTTVAGIVLDLPEYDPARIHLSRPEVTDVYEISGKLLGMTHNERAEFPVIHPGRVDVIAAGALVLARTSRRVGVTDIVVSEHDILDGLARSVG